MTIQKNLSYIDIAPRTHTQPCLRQIKGNVFDFYLLSNLLKSSDPFVPPKPKELDNA
jgi:hypothetical protein